PHHEWERLAGDEGFLEHLRRVYEAFQGYLQRPPKVTIEGVDEEQVVAYFSLEFALTESLPVYSGGLGVLAGDHLKSASDLGIPFVGVGLLYRQGYFHQSLGQDGWQQEEYRDIDVAQQPLQRMRNAAGEPLTVEVPLNGRNVVVAVWRLDVGQTPLYLLDTDMEENSPEDREIGARLYGGDIATRIEQEMLLGIGGVRALRAMGLNPAVCHMNEGHSALLGVERIRTLMEETGISFEEAMLPVAAATVFTTHTAVAAGIDLFPPDLVREYLGQYYTSMGLSDRQFLGLGRMNPDDEAEPFSMALLGIRLSGERNGVSKLHRTVSRRLWDSAWPALPEEQIPIGAITNGVHLPTWVAHELGELYDAYVGHDWRDDPVRPEAWERVQDIPSQQLWDAKQRQRHMLVHRAREQHRDSSAMQGLSALDGRGGQVLDPNALTIGFARRFAGYKRAVLLFRDPERLARIVNNADRPVQFLFAGKAHPRDEPAKQVIREVVQHSRLPEFRDRLVVLERYDVDLARSLVQGCDVWLNTPLRPLEASGTSGMKAVANGGLHMSVLDGWWAEAYEPGLGWAIGRDRIDDDPEVQDAFDAESLYTLLESEVVPMFYNRNADGIPEEWVARMKASIARFSPQFTTQRMVAEYVDVAYRPAAQSWARLRESDAARARELNRWLQYVREHWDEIKVHVVEDDSSDPAVEGKAVTVGVQVHLGQLSPDDVTLDVVYGIAGPRGELASERSTRMELAGVGEDGVCRYEASLSPEIHGRVGYVVRVLPWHEDLHNVMDLGLVYWA
ncbi:MAG: alpha-glucan family phosphorylase, partial [Dehalococcoidia bacterium]|nr:alpha-glucan family phosphorylase [Dehalococcoidia bacterium]